MKKLLFLSVLIALICSFSCQSKKYDNLPSSLAELNRKIDKSPKNSDLYQLRAEYFYRNNQVDKALADILHAIKLNDKKSTYYVTLADIYLAKNETDLVEEMLKKAISIDDLNEAYLKLAELYLYQYMYRESDEILERAIRLQNHNPKAFLTRAILLRETGDTLGWLRMMQLVIDQDPFEVIAYSDLAYYFQERLDPLAISYYKNALDVSPNDKILNYNLGKLYQDLGALEMERGKPFKNIVEFELAKEQYKNLIAIDPRSYPAYNNLGYIALVYEDNYEEAIRYFTKAIELDSLYDQAWCNRGIAYFYLEDWQNARADFLQSRRINPYNEGAIKELNRLDAMRK
ncbi:MAG: tetratricopeptide repeat protein [Bacteroidetes bacterium]|nr:tetratricopeptide repeat protein [Bacteroidota bacterium]MCL2302957.1 tetratricopeptide repeat protein [Lentimicrobiaceae bacterium]